MKLAGRHPIASISGDN